MQSVNAALQWRPSAGELALVLALVRAGKLAPAAQLAGVDGSTVFRTVQRLERRLGQRLFERSRAGYRATDLGQRLAAAAERIEAELEAATGAVGLRSGGVQGLVRLSTTDTLLHGLVLPLVPALHALHPALRLDLAARNEAANLTQREADIALRATLRPPPHLVGRRLGAIRSAVFTAAPARARRARVVDLAVADWIAVDEALPEHPSVRWRRRAWPKVAPALLVNSVQSVFEAVAAGAGVGVLPLFLAAQRGGVRALTPPLPECETELWLLTHPESRHLRRIATVAAFLAERIELPA